MAIARDFSNLQRNTRKPTANWGKKRWIYLQIIPRRQGVQISESSHSAKIFSYIILFKGRRRIIREGDRIYRGKKRIKEAGARIFSRGSSFPSWAPQRSFFLRRREATRLEAHVHTVRRKRERDEFDWTGLAWKIPRIFQVIVRGNIAYPSWIFTCVRWKGDFFAILRWFKTT